MRLFRSGLLLIVFLAGLSILCNAKADLELLSWCWYLNDLGYYQVVGEAQNVGDSNAQFVMFTATWYSSSGHVVGTQFSFALLDILRPGEKSPFLITLLDENVEAEKVRIQWTWNETTKDPLRDVSVRDINANYDTDLRCLRIQGEVENRGSHSAEYVMIILTGYNDEGDVVAAGFTFTTLNTVAPGGLSPFKTYLCDRAAEIKQYSWVVQHN